MNKEKYNLFDLGYNRYLTKDDSFYNEIAQMANAVENGVNPAIIGSGDMSGNYDLVSGHIQSANFVSGSAGWQISADGDAEFNSVTVRGTIYATLGEIGGFTIGATTLYSDGNEIVLDSANKRIEVGADDAIVLDGANKRITVGASNEIIIDGANKKIESGNYVSGYAGSGFHIDENLGEFGNIACRGLIRTAVFQKDTISVMGGNFLTLDGDVIDADMTVADNSTLTTKGVTTFSVNDILRIKDGTDDEWLKVTAVNGNVYTVERDKKGDYGAGANPAWKKGVSVTNYQQSGNGGIYQTASESNAPYLSVFTHAGSPWTDLTTRLRLGNLNGFLGEDSDVYGIAIGESTKYLKYDPTNGLELSGHIVSKYTTGEAITKNDVVCVKNTTTVIDATNDAFVDSTSPDTNYSQNTVLLIDNNYQYETFIKFPLNIDENIQKATLKLFVQNVASTGNTFRIIPVTSADWSETTITWNNKPTSSGYELSIINITSSYLGTWIEIDVTHIVRLWLEGTLSNYGFRLQAGGTGNLLQFRSEEYAGDYAPRLEVIENTVSDGKIYKADCDDYNLCRNVIGIAAETQGSANQTIKIWDNNGSIIWGESIAGAVPSNYMYLSNTAGAVTVDPVNLNRIIKLGKGVGTTNGNLRLEVELPSFIEKFPVDTAGTVIQSNYFRIANGGNDVLIAPKDAYRVQIQISANNTTYNSRDLEYTLNVYRTGQTTDELKQGVDGSNSFTGAKAVWSQDTITIYNSTYDTADITVYFYLK